MPFSIVNNLFLCIILMNYPQFNTFDFLCSSIDQINCKNCEVEEVKMINGKQGKLYGVIRLKSYHNRKHILYFSVLSLKCINPQLSYWNFMSST
jgi:hypothetical protein